MGFFDTDTKTESKVTPYRQHQLDAILADIEMAGNKPFTFFGDQTYAGFDPLQTEALQGREAFAREQMPGMIDPAMQAWQSTLSAPDVASNPYVQGMLEQQQRLANRNLEENILPMLSDQASIQGGVGGFGGTGHRISEGLAAGRTQEALLNEAAKTQLGAYGQGLGQQQYGLSATPGMMSIGMSPYDTLAGVGGAYQGMDQNAINEAMARHEFAQNEPWMRAEREAALYHPLASPYAKKEGTVTESPSTLGKISQIGGLVSSIGGMGFGGFGGGAPTPMPGTSGGGWGGYNAGNFMPMSGFGFQGVS